MVGPSLIPLLTLSIPGSPTAAVLLGGLLIHGIFPGHDILSTNKAVIWTFIDSLNRSTSIYADYWFVSKQTQ